MVRLLIGTKFFYPGALAQGNFNITLPLTALTANGQIKDLTNHNTGKHITKPECVREVSSLNLNV